MSYSHLKDDQPPRKPVDHTARWTQLRPIGNVDAATKADIERFCASKRITFDALEALGTRFVRHHRLGPCFAYGGSNGNGRIVAIKYRAINGTSRDSEAEQPSVWLRPLVIGNLASLDWLIAEGETDGARLYGLVGDRCAILVLPAGAPTFKPEWAAVIPRGARVGLCHDADEKGDGGAETAAQAIGGLTARIRPPDGGDWCDWDGDREAFLELAFKPIAASLDVAIVTAEQFAAVDEPGATALVGAGDEILIPEGGDVMFYGDGGAAKTTLSIDLACHLATPREWLGHSIGRAVSVLIIENEGPRPLFRQKIRHKLDAWNEPLHGRVKVQEAPWAQFTLATAEWRAGLAETVKDHEIDVLIIGPLTRIGMNTAGTLQEVVAFVKFLQDVRAQAERPLTVVLIHHENKGGTVSGAWEGAGDTLLHCEKRGNGFTDVHIQKARWASASHDTTLHLAWTDGAGFKLKDERDVHAAMLLLLKDGKPRTVKEMMAALKAGEGAIKDAIKDHPTDYYLLTSEEAKEAGRSPKAKLYRIAQTTFPGTA